jgi:hypothetical protein
VVRLTSPLSWPFTGSRPCQRRSTAWPSAAGSAAVLAITPSEHLTRAPGWVRQFVYLWVRQFVYFLRPWVPCRKVMLERAVRLLGEVRGDDDVQRYEAYMGRSPQMAIPIEGQTSGRSRSRVARVHVD